jgi:hypothetical protein
VTTAIHARVDSESARKRDRRLGVILLVTPLALGLALCAAGWPATGASLAAPAAAAALGLAWAHWPHWRRRAWWRGGSGLRQNVGPRSFLAYARFLHLKLALACVFTALLAYALHDPPGGPSGGSALGYALGVYSTLLVLWLLWFGVKKRSYGAGGASLSAWLSAHVYLGAALAVLVPLHAAFEVGWNLHSLAGALLFLTLASGLFGVAVYSELPARITRNHPGEKLEGLFKQVADLDEQLLAVAGSFADADAQDVRRAIDDTRLGGGLLAQFFFSEERCPTTRALRSVRQSADPSDDQHRAIALLTSRRMLLRRIRRDIRYKAVLEIWLLLHVPISLACTAAIAVHVFAVFYYR